MPKNSKLIAIAASVSLVGACALIPGLQKSAATQSGLSANVGSGSPAATVTSSSIRGTVTFMGQPDASGITVKAFPVNSPPGARSYGATTGAGGAYSIAVPDGLYNLVATKPGTNYAAARFSVQSASVVNIDLVPTGTIDGTVSASPVLPSWIGTQVFVPGTDIAAYTDASGSYQLDNVPTGTYTLAAMRQGSGVGSIANVSVTAGATTMASNIDMTASMVPVGFKLKLADISTNVEVDAIDDSGVVITLRDFQGNTYSATTDASGDATVTAPAGVYQTSFAKPGYLTEGFNQFDTVVAFANSINTVNYQTLFTGNLGLLAATGSIALNQTEKFFVLGHNANENFSAPSYNPYPTPNPSASFGAGPVAPQGPFPMVETLDPTLFTWTVSNPAVATVSAGFFMPLATGTVEVDATDIADPTRKATQSVTVGGFPPDAVLTAQFVHDNLPLAGLPVTYNPISSTTGLPGATVSAPVTSDASGDYFLTDTQLGLAAGTSALYQFSWSDGGLTAATSSDLATVSQVVSAQINTLTSTSSDFLHPQAPLNLAWDGSFAPGIGSTIPATLATGTAATFSFTPYVPAPSYFGGFLQGPLTLEYVIGLFNSSKVQIASSTQPVSDCGVKTTPVMIAMDYAGNVYSGSSGCPSVLNSGFPTSPILISGATYYYRVNFYQSFYGGTDLYGNSKYIPVIAQ